MKYNIYHDESKETGYWHCFLFVPTENQSLLINFLKKARENTNYSGKELSFKNLGSNTSFECAKSWISIFSSAVQSKLKGGTEPFYLGKGEYSEDAGKREVITDKFDRAMKCKVAIFKKEDKHKDMFFGRDGLSKIERTFEMGLQGASHYLFDNDNTLEVNSIFLDGEEHYNIEYNRDFNKDKVLHNLDSEYREYCYIRDDVNIEGENLDNNDQLLIELTDIILGVFRYGVENPDLEYCKTRKDKERFELCKFFDSKISKNKKGYTRMFNSRYEKFGTFSSAFLDENEEWNFEDLSEEFLSKEKPENISFDF